MEQIAFAQAAGAFVAEAGPTGTIIVAVALVYLGLKRPRTEKDAREESDVWLKHIAESMRGIQPVLEDIRDEMRHCRSEVTELRVLTGKIERACDILLVTREK